MSVKIYDIRDFNWGWMNSPVYKKNGEEEFVYHKNKSTPLGKYHKISMIKEIFDLKIYQKHNNVQENDIVVDVGASVGPFSYSIKNKNPKHIYCIEPCINEFKTLEDNLSKHKNISLINKGISHKNGIIKTNTLFGDEDTMNAFTFKKFISENKIKKIDFLKFDCEGGEYDIFNFKNKNWLQKNLKYAAGEFHLSTPELKTKFRKFRDSFLPYFPHHRVHAVCGTDIKWDLWNEHFIEFYNEVIFYIDNR